MGAKVSITMTAAEFDATRKLIKVGIAHTKEKAVDAYASSKKNEGWDLEALATEGEKLLKGPLG